MKFLSNQVSNNRHTQRRTPENVHGRYMAGQPEQEWWYATSHVGFGTKRPWPRQDSPVRRANVITNAARRARPRNPAAPGEQKIAQAV